MVNVCSTLSRGGVEINEDNFPDTIFREYVKKQFDKDTNNSLSETEIENVKKIDVGVEEYENIGSLQGIEYFKNLTELDCRNLKSVTKIDTSSFLHLQTLVCLNTGITELDVSFNTELKMLLCGMTKITELDLTNNKKLVNLNCHGTDLTSLDLTANSELKTLDCYSSNKLTNLNVEKNDKLEKLWCYNSEKLEKLDVSKNKNLKDLRCDYTKIKTLDLSANSELERLNCSHTDIIGLDVTQNKKMKSLNCENNYKLVYLNLGEASLNLEGAKAWSPINLTITGDTFNILNEFPGVSRDKITVISNADYNPQTGIFTKIDPGNTDPWIKYQYDCGTNNGKKITLNVNLYITVQKGESTVAINADAAKNLSKTYNGEPVALAKENCTVTGSNGSVSFVYEQKNEQGEWTEMKEAPVHGGSYRVTATLAGNAYYNGATSAPVEFTILPAENVWTKSLDITGWTYGEKANTPTAEAKSGSEVKFTYSNKENGAYTETVPTTAGTWYVKAIATATSDYEELTAIKEFTIAKAKAPEITLPENLSATQDDKLESIKLPVGWTWVDKSTTVTVKNNGYPARLVVDDANYDYSLVKGYDEDGHYIERTLSVKVSQGTNAWTEEPSIERWTYNDPANDPVGKAQHGTVVFTYSSSKDGKFTSEVPSTAGTWYLKASVPETDEYAELSKIIEFKIAKAVPEYVAPTNLNAVYGQKLEDVELAEGFTWEEPSLFVGNVGTNKFEAVYTPKDINNYQIVKDIELTITVEKAENTWTQPLKITGWTYGEKPNVPTATAKYGTPTFQYSNQKDGTYTEKMPTSIGIWYVKAIVAGTANYSGLESDPVSFTISQRWVPSRPTDGLHQGSDGELWYYKDGKIDKEFEGIVEYNGSQFYVKDGKVQKVDGLTLVKDKWYFLTDGRVQTQHTGLVQYDGEWFYITEGILDTSISGVVPYDGGEFVFTQGRLIQELNGLWLNPGDNTWYFIANGQVQRDYTGLALYDGHWFHVVKGVFDQTYTGLVLYDNAWFYVTKGELNTNISGVVSYNGGKFIFSAGRLANEVNGLWLNPKDKKWYFASNGQIQTQYIGVAMYDNEWFYIRKGILATDYNGTIQYNGATFRVRAGQLRGQIK